MQAYLSPVSGSRPAFDGDANNQHLQIAMLLLALLLGLAASQPIDTANTTCFGASFRTIASQFKYKAFLDGTNCSLANTRCVAL